MKLRYKSDDLYGRFDGVMRSMAISTQKEHKDSRLRQAYLKVVHQTFGQPEEVGVRTANKMAESLTDTIRNFQSSLDLKDSDIRELRKLFYKEIKDAFEIDFTEIIEEE